MKTYVGSGDRGRTSLLSGERVEKSHGRVEALGEVDELNSLLGALIAALPEKQGEPREELKGIQADLFHVGAWLATSPPARRLAICCKRSARGLSRLGHRIPP